MSESSVLIPQKQVKGLANWLSLDLTIKIFGVTILEWHYPPLNER